MGKTPGDDMLGWKSLLLAVLLLAGCGDGGGKTASRESLLFGARDTEGGNYVLWQTDGTSSGTRQVSAGLSMQSNALFQNMPTLNGRHYFTAAQPGSVVSLWETDGTEAGTRRIQSLLHQGPFFPSGLRVAGDVLYFTGSVPTQGAFLWRTDGTPEGTLRLDQAAAGDAQPYPSSPRQLGDHLFFMVQSGTTKQALMRLALADDSVELLREFDRNAVRQMLVYGENLMVSEMVGNRHRLLLIDPENGESETLLELPVQGGISAINSLAVAGGYLYFRAQNEESGQELWISDGTAAGTRLHTDLSEGEASTWFRVLQVADDTLIVEGVPDGEKLHIWVVDGPDAAPRVLHVMENDSYSDRVMGVHQGRVYFHEKYDEEKYRLCSVDMKKATLRCLKQEGISLSPEFPLSVLNGRLLFVADSDEYGRELWQVPTTLSRAKLVHDVCHGSCSAF